MIFPTAIFCMQLMPSHVSSLHSLQLEALRTHYEEALAKKNRIISRRDATIAKAAKDATAQLAAKDTEIVRLQARVQQFEDAAAAMSRLSCSTKKRSRADATTAAAAAGGGNSSSGTTAGARPSQQQGTRTSYIYITCLQHRHDFYDGWSASAKEALLWRCTRKKQLVLKLV
jgi:hypothetical protein